jgi:dTDP-4-dehydrorhamnose reductase
MVGKTPRPPVTRILVLGSRGRVGAALVRQWLENHTVQALARPELDAADLPALERLLDRFEFDILVNATGLTNVDRCESARDEAVTVNTEAPSLMARVAAAKGARFIHFSTDYVFDGTQTRPYTENDPARPLGHYGATKLAGEAAALAASSRHLVLRVSWVFGPDKPSFVDMIIERALANDRVEAIADKTSSPTAAEDIAGWVEPFLTDSNELPGGLYHACNAGGCTWQAYGQYTLDCALKAGWPLRARTVEPIALADMNNFSAPRPPHTVMDTTKLSTVIERSPRPWQEALEEFLLWKFRNSLKVAGQ